MAGLYRIGMLRSELEAWFDRGEVEIPAERFKHNWKSVLRSMPIHHIQDEHAVVVLEFESAANRRRPGRQRLRFGEWRRAIVVDDRARRLNRRIEELGVPLDIDRGFTKAARRWFTKAYHEAALRGAARLVGWLFQHDIAPSPSEDLKSTVLAVVAQRYEEDCGIKSRKKDVPLRLRFVGRLFTYELQRRVDWLTPHREIVRFIRDVLTDDPLRGMVNEVLRQANEWVKSHKSAAGREAGGCLLDDEWKRVVERLDTDLRRLVNDLPCHLASCAVFLQWKGEWREAGDRLDADRIRSWAERLRQLGMERFAGEAAWLLGAFLRYGDVERAIRTAEARAAKVNESDAAPAGSFPPIRSDPKKSARANETDGAVGGLWGASGMSDRSQQDVCPEGEGKPSTGGGSESARASGSDDGGTAPASDSKKAP